MASVSETRVFDPDGELLLILNRSLPKGHSEKPTAVDPNGVKSRASATYPETSTATHEVIHLIVSSKHMRLASPVFKAILQPGVFKEGSELLKNGKAEVPLPDDDPDIFTILLDIIHGRGSRVPRLVNFQTLATLAVLVDKYQLQELVALCLCNWLVAFEEDPLKAVFGHTTQTWISIFWVFEQADEFKKVTKLAVEMGDDQFFDAFSKSELPVPQRVIGT